ncbi:MAG: HNH endonuclease [Clostridia bacterium]|nr:HNH endonuclease [Clostridia bacterium]
MNQDINYWFLLVIIGLLAICGLIYFAIVFVKKKHRKIVETNSQKVSLVNRLNAKYSFNNILPMYYLEKECSSKREYDRLDYKSYLFTVILADSSHYYQILQKVYENQVDYESYTQQYNSIVSNKSDIDTALYTKWRFFEKVEAKVCEKLVLNPVTELKINIQKSYCSPQGRNSYCSEYTFNTSDVIDCYRKVECFNEYKKSVKYQRERMSDSLRYDVMKRDGFRCVLCGASAQEGAKLHVDHILPVSKGGKTEMKNLRTLCNHCNLGKRDKYDSNGPN